jgi:hypothetical protein
MGKVGVAARVAAQLEQKGLARLIQEQRAQDERTELAARVRDAQAATIADWLGQRVAPRLGLGTIIWRDYATIAETRHGLVILDVDVGSPSWRGYFVETGHRLGQLMCKINVADRGHWVSQPGKYNGICCFLREAPPTDWLALKVVRLGEGRRNGVPTTVYAVPATVSEAEWFDKHNPPDLLAELGRVTARVRDGR